MTLGYEDLVCLDCGEGPVRALLVRQPKDANFAFRARSDVAPDDDKYVLVKCGNCGSVFLHPYYFEEAGAVYSDPRYFTRYYPENIHTGGGPREGARYGRRYEPRRARQILRVSGLCRSAAPLKIGDIGCAHGFLVRAFTELGHEAYGAEISELAVEAQANGLNVHHGFFQDAGFPAGFFDLIVSTQVFEHIVDLVPLCKAIRRTLRPEGVVVLTVPNDLQGFKSLVWRHRPWWLIPPIHVRYFTAASARRIFSRHGLQLVRVATQGSTGRTLATFLRWCLGRTFCRALAQTRAYEAFCQLLYYAMWPIDRLLALGGRHNELVLVLRKA